MKGFEEETRKKEKKKLARNVSINPVMVRLPLSKTTEGFPTSHHTTPANSLHPSCQQGKYLIRFGWSKLLSKRQGKTATNKENEKWDFEERTG